MTMAVRALRAGDEVQWRRLWAGYLAFYGSSDLSEAITASTFKRLLEEPKLFAFVAERDDALIGFVHAVTHPATWALNDYCYLEDLFVDDAIRSAGAGRALIEAVYDEARGRGCAQVYWLTQETNAKARILYDKLASHTGFVHYRLKL